MNALLPMLLNMQISHPLTIHSGCSSFIKNPSLQESTNSHRYELQGAAQG
jgi:hypothetical protein